MNGNAQPTADGGQPKRRHRSGMTLVEMLVVSALFGIIAATLLTAFLTGRNSYVSADAYLHVQQQARQAFDIMTKELRNAGHISTGGRDDCNFTMPATPPPPPGVQRLDFQIDQGYDNSAAPPVGTGCGTGVSSCTPPIPWNGICWGDGTTRGQWVHYEVDVPNQRLVRYTTATKGELMPANCVGCRVLANNVNVDSAATWFEYNAANRTVNINLHVRMQSSQLPGGSMGTQPSPLRTQIQLRNP